MASGTSQTQQGSNATYVMGCVTRKATACNETPPQNARHIYATGFSLSCNSYSYSIGEKISPSCLHTDPQTAQGVSGAVTCIVQEGRTRTATTTNKIEHVIRPFDIVGRSYLWYRNVSLLLRIEANVCEWVNTESKSDKEKLLGNEGSGGLKLKVKQPPASKTKNLPTQASTKQ